MRSFIEKNLDQLGGIHKFFYLFPMFRYERQQAGRFRQHHQFGVETIGIRSPLQDVECIDLLYTLLDRLGLKGLTLHINSIGSSASRKEFQHALKSHLHPFFDELSIDSKERYHSNPLRILDSKNPHDRKLLQEAPTILDYLDSDSKMHFEGLCQALETLEIPYVINPYLVRGLDYYTDTVFEITAEQLGAPNSLGGGGRYDGLIKELGGPDLPAFGFGAGLERIIQTMLGQKVALPPASHPKLFLIPFGEEAKNFCFSLTHELRKNHLFVEIDLSGKKLKNAMRFADSLKVKFVAVVGDEELRNNTFKIKELESGKEESLLVNQLVERLKND